MSRAVKVPRSSPGMLPSVIPGIDLLLAGRGLHDLSTAGKGNTGVSALTHHDGFNQGLIDIRRSIPANQEIGTGPTGHIRPLDHELD